jgi:hypothetical protein
MARRQKPITAGELMARLEKDPEFQARKAERDREFAERGRPLDAAEAPLVAALRGICLEVVSVWDLLSRDESSAELVGLLLEHFPKDYPDVIREGIARALTCRHAVAVVPDLIELYRKEPENKAKQGLAVAISGVAQPEHAEAVLGLIRDARFGESRILLLTFLDRAKDLDTRALLMEFGGDPVLAIEVQEMIERRRARERRAARRKAK